MTPRATPPLLRWRWPGSPLFPARLLRRYNRFLADFESEDPAHPGHLVAHCVNTGRMEALTQPGLRCWLSHDPSPTRKLQYTWQIAELDGHMIGANTAVPNQLVRALLEARTLAGFDDWTTMRPEAPYGANSRVDFLLHDSRGAHYVEVKNCHLIYPDDIGYFPDSVSERATKHLEELTSLLAEGHRASVIFTAQRAGVKAVRPSDAHDPTFAAAARRAAAAGVKFLALEVVPTAEEIQVRRAIPADVEPYDVAPMKAWMDKNRALGPAWFTVRRSKPE